MWLFFCNYSPGGKAPSFPCFNFCNHLWHILIFRWIPYFLIRKADSVFPSQFDESIPARFGDFSKAYFIICIWAFERRGCLPGLSLSLSTSILPPSPALSLCTHPVNACGVFPYVLDTSEQLVFSLSSNNNIPWSLWENFSSCELFRYSMICRFTCSGFFMDNLFMLVDKYK